MTQERRPYLNEIPEEQKLPLRTVLDPEFVRATTCFDSCDAFFDASPWAWRTPSQFRALTNDDRFDRYVARNSRFSSWRKMEDTATLRWLYRDPEKCPPVTDLLSDAFVWQKTGYASYGEFFAAGGWTVGGARDVATIPDAALDQHVAQETKFKTWQDMVNEAVLRWVDRQLLA